MDELLRAIHDLKNVIECNKWYIEQNINAPLEDYTKELAKVLAVYDNIIIDKVKQTFIGRDKEVTLHNCPPVSQDCIHLDGEWNGYVSELLNAETEKVIWNRLKYSPLHPDEVEHLYYLERDGNE